MVGAVKVRSGFMVDEVGVHGRRRQGEVGVHGR